MNVSFFFYLSKVKYLGYLSSNCRITSYIYI